MFQANAESHGDDCCRSNLLEFAERLDNEKKLKSPEADVVYAAITASDIDNPVSRDPEVPSFPEENLLRHLGQKLVGNVPEAITQNAVAITWTDSPIMGIVDE